MRDARKTKEKGKGITKEKKKTNYVKKKKLDDNKKKKKNDEIQGKWRGGGVGHGKIIYK